MSQPKIPLSLIIPVYNEEKRILPTLEILRLWIPHSIFKVELIIVDDGSTDRTTQIIQEYSKFFDQLKLIQTKHVGYMNAIITGLKASQNPFLGTLEADCPVHPQVLEEFMIEMNQNDIVMGSRQLRMSSASIEGKSLLRRLLSNIMSNLFSFLFQGEIKDPQIGFKLYKLEVLNKVLPQLRLHHDGLKSAEILVKARSYGYRIKEVPVHYKHDEDSRCVPKGNYRVIFKAAFAVFTLWLQSYVEFKKGMLPNSQVKFGFLLRPFWRLVA